MSKQSKRKSIPKRDPITIWDFLKDIVVPIAVGVSAIIVAVQANRIADLQAMIAKNSERPTIEVTEHSFLDNFESEMEDSIDITILDGKYSNYQSEIITFLICEYDDFDENSQHVPFKTVGIPVLNYFDSHARSQSLYGKVETIYTLGNSTVIRSLGNSAKDKYEETSNRTFTTSVESYLRITYTNLLDEPEVVYYLLDGNGTGPVARLNEEYGEARFKEWNDLTQDGLQITPGIGRIGLFGLLITMDEAFEPYRN